MAAVGHHSVLASVLPAYGFGTEEKEYVSCERSRETQLQFLCNNVLGKGVRITTENATLQLCEVKILAPGGRT